MMNPSYPEDLYDDGDYLVEVKKSEIRNGKISHFIMGMGFGVMTTIALAGFVAWFIG
jgi:hypothetical protein